MDDDPTGIPIGGDVTGSILVTSSQNVILQAGQVLIQAAAQARREGRDPARMLRILAAPVYDPDHPDRMPTPLDLKQEWHELAQKVRGRHAPILLARLTPPTLDALRDALLPPAEHPENFPHIFHFSGHAWKGGLLLEDKFGQLHPVKTAELLEALQGLPRPLNLVVLNGCETAADEVLLLGDETLCFAGLGRGESLIDDHHPPGNLPSRADLFFGRGADLAAIARALDHPPAIALLSGPSGIGKSSPALEAAHRQAWRFSGGVAYAKGPDAESGQPATCQGLLLSLAQVLGLNTTPEKVGEDLGGAD